MMLLLDVGGSVTRIAVAEKEGALGAPVLLPTEPTVTAGLEKITEAAVAAANGAAFEMVVLGITGQVSPEGMLVRSPNLPGWGGNDLKKIFSERFGCPVALLNDAVLGGVGEAVAGAGKGAHVLLYMTLGTGIGFARILDGIPDLSIGSETGHQYIDIDGEHLVEAEDAVSGRAIRARLGVGGEEVRDPAVWEEYARLAAIPLYNNILAYAPDRVVVGGSLVKEGSLSIPALAGYVRKIATHVEHVPDIVPATLGDLCGLYGAQAYARRIS